ncbi:ABC transporter substrate-binding protein [Beutenbergia cavernae]|uniref:ABC transporter substrate-binding protein n=1 Tax=Beutenbergia cavernae TaxID=84757 RepID=UPI000301B959|nr:extracellular solute-binding protein [Beutenbergia cavernae]
MPDAELRIVWWGAEDRADAINAALDVVTEREPGLTFVSEYSGFDGYFPKLTTQIAGGNAPDIAAVNFVPERVDYAQRGALLDLTPYVESGALDLSGYDDATIDYGRTGDGLYGLPTSISTQAVLVNTDVFDEYGLEVPADDWTWDEFIALSNGVTEATGGAVHGTEDVSALHWVYETWYFGKTGDLIYEDDSGARTDDVEDVTEWFEMWADLRESGGTVPADVQAAHTIGDYPTSPLVTGDAAMSFQFTSAASSFRPLSPSPLALVAQPSAGDNPHQYIRPSTMWAITADTAHPDSAVAAVNVLVNDEDALLAVGLSTGMPASARAREVLEPTLAPEDAEVIDFVSRISELPTTAAPSIVPGGARDVEDLFIRIAQEVSFGQLTPAEGAQAFFDEAEGLLG